MNRLLKTLGIMAIFVFAGVIMTIVLNVISATLGLWGIIPILILCLFGLGYHFYAMMDPDNE